jgi:hypothetical protein
MTIKNSSHSFFLKVLKVSVQLREAALLAIKRHRKLRKMPRLRRRKQKLLQIC